MFIAIFIFNKYNLNEHFAHHLYIVFVYQELTALVYHVRLPSFRFELK